MGLVYKWMGGISNSCVLANAAPQGRQTGGVQASLLFGTKKIRVFSANAQPSFASVVLNRVLGPSPQACHT